MDKLFRKFPIDNTIDQQNSYGFVDNNTVDNNRYGRDIYTSDNDIVPGSMENSMKRTKTKSSRKKKMRKKKKKAIIKKILADQKRGNVPFNAGSIPLVEISEEENIFPDLQEEDVSNNENLLELSSISELSEVPEDDYMFADEIVVNNGLNLETENLDDDAKKEYSITKVVPSPNNEDTSDDCMSSIQMSMTVHQNLMMGLKVNRPLRYCPFCEYITIEGLEIHIMQMHYYIMNEPIEKNINQLLSIQTESCKLIRLNTVRDIVGRKLWQDPTIRKTLHTLLKMLQVELWLGSWALPNVPFFNHLAPYVKTSYINNWFENEKKEEIDDPPSSPSSVITKSTSIYTEGSEQDFNYNGHYSHDNVDNMSEGIPNVPNYFESLTERLRNAGLLKKLNADHPLISLYRNVFRKKQPNKPLAINMQLATTSRVLRYVQDKCIQNELPVHHWLVLLQKPDYIIEYLRL
ncbi:uncharacterized protein LOC132926332 isoform X2 [Rhopalosiphum padi]|nr:uncharacterized protein LOC132926332 isoform X2 [Rhopalosiphum padi]